MPLVLPTRRKLILGSVASLAAFQSAHAITTAQKGALGGVPGWVRALTPGAIPQVAADFANNRYWQSGVGTTSFTDLFALTRAAQETVTWSSGALTYAASGQPAQGDLGLAVWGSRINSLLWSTDLTNATWSTLNLAQGTDGTIAPDGSIAQKFTATAVNGAHQLSPTTAVTISSTVDYTTSIYIKPGTNKFFYLALSRNSDNNYISAVFDLSTNINGTASQTSTGSSSGTVVSTTQTYLGGGWFRLRVIGHITGSAAYLLAGPANAATGNSFDVRGNVTFSAAGTESGYIFAPQLELGLFSSPYIPTTTTVGTRTADQLAIIGTLKSIFASPSGWLYANVGGSPNSNTPTIWDKDNSNNTPAYFDTTSTITSIMAGVSLQATLGSGSQAGNVKSVVTWNAAGRSLVANGGTVVSDANTLAGSNTPYLGSGGGANFFYDGNFSAIAAGNVRLSDALSKSIST